MSSAIEQILSQLAVALGEEAVRSACLKFCMGKKASSETVPAEEKKKRASKPRGPNPWTTLVSEVQAELQAAANEAAAGGEPVKITRKIAMEEAGKRKRAEAGPEAEAEFQRKKSEKAAKKAAGLPASAESSSAESSDAEEGEIPPPPPTKAVKKAVKKTA